MGIYSKDIGVEFGREKCAMLIVKSSEQQMTEGIELPNQEKNQNTWRKEIYKYLVILKADTTKQAKLKDKIKKEYLRRTRKLLETKLHSKNLVKGMNTWAVPFVIYSGPFLKWTKVELQQMNQRIRKFMTMHKGLTYQWWRRQTVWVKKEEEDSQAFKIASMHRYND